MQQHWGPPHCEPDIARGKVLRGSETCKTPHKLADLLSRTQSSQRSLHPNTKRRLANARCCLRGWLHEDVAVAFTLGESLHWQKQLLPGPAVPGDGRRGNTFHWCGTFCTRSSKTLKSCKVEHCVHEGSTQLPTHASPPTVAITEMAANKTKGLTRFSSGFAFPAEQQLDLSGLDLQSRCGLNFKEEKKGYVVKENARCQTKYEILFNVSHLLDDTSDLGSRIKELLVSTIYERLIAVNEAWKKIVKNNQKHWISLMAGKLLQPEYRDRQQLVIIFQTTTVENGQNLAKLRGKKEEQAWAWL